MPQFTTPFAALDPDTREYLREVRKRQGERTPGLYVAGSNWWPLWAFLAGPLVLVVGVLFAIGSSKDAWAVALLLTAAGMLGGWLIVYAFRRWLGTGSADFAGYFTYFDPTHVYRATGEEVTVCPMSDPTAVSVQHQSSEGKYSGSVIHFRSGGTANRVPVSGQANAELIGFYYQSVAWLRAHEDAKWRELPAAEQGGVAKYVAAADALPRDAKDIDLEVATVPAEPHTVGKGPGNGVRYLAVLGIGGLLFLALWASMGPTADELAYSAAKDSPTALRAYLLDERNTRHREDAQKRLAELYAPAETKAQAGTDEQMKKGLLAVLAGLKTAPSPVTSLNVSETGLAADMANAGARTRALRTDLADAFAQHIGPELIAFVQPPDGQKPHIELEYRIEPAGADLRVVWRLRFRPDPAAESIDGAEHPLPPIQGNPTVATVLTMIKADVFDKLFRTGPPAIIVAGDGDW